MLLWNEVKLRQGELSLLLYAVFCLKGARRFAQQQGAVAVCVLWEGLLHSDGCGSGILQTRAVCGEAAGLEVLLL